MATSTRNTTIQYTGDVAGTEQVNAASNANSPAQVQRVTLAAGDNTFTVPTNTALGGLLQATCLTVVKPAGNTVLLKIKGVGGDTGVVLHKTDPDSISVDTSQASVIINAVSQVLGVILIWT